MLLYDLGSMKEAAASYEHKAKVLRQIHSDKLRKAANRSTALTILTICFSVIFVFVSAVGIQRLQQSINPKADSFLVELLYNLLVVSVVLMTIVQMGLNLPDKIITHLNSVKKLTAFVIYLNDIARVVSCTEDDAGRFIADMATKYTVIIEILPESSDREWAAAKSEFDKKLPK